MDKMPKWKVLESGWLGWYQDLEFDHKHLETAERYLVFSKLSGAIGNYAGVDPELEQKALGEMNLVPYLGATQIIPREVYAPLAQALCQIVLTVHKIALAIRLGSRSGDPVYHEPFGKKQKGSSRMPGKKNPIIDEQLEGLARMALGYLVMIMQNIPTWEERSIEQSCVERVAWPDLFHVTVHALEKMTQVIEGLVVYPDTMMKQLLDSGGCYASGQAYEILKHYGTAFGLQSDEAYRIVQLAAFNVLETPIPLRVYRVGNIRSLEGADQVFNELKHLNHYLRTSIQGLIPTGLLKVSEELEVTQETVSRWNKILVDIFASTEVEKKWAEIFKPSHLLRNEKYLFDAVFQE